MVKYSHPEADSLTKAARARGSQLRVHFKNTRETGAAIKKMPLLKAITFLEDVLEFKQAIPFRRFAGGRGRHAQGKLRQAPGDQVGWPVKSVKYVLDLLKNAKANAETKDLDVDALYVKHIQVQRAMKQRRRTYRAHGRIGPYMCSPCHVELIVAEREEAVAKGEEEAPKKISRKRLAKMRLKSGGGVDN